MNIDKAKTHSLTLKDIKEEEIKNILNDYSLLSKFNIPTMVTIINNYCNDDEKIKYLRNEQFIKEIPSYLLELIFTNMQFESVFNMLQNKEILNKINNLDVYIDNTYPGLVTSYLNSESLVKKTSSIMLSKPLNTLKQNEINDFINKKYIKNKLSNKNLIDLAINNNIILNETDKLSQEELEYYIDNILQKTKNIDIINNNTIAKRIFNLNDNTLNKINFDEVKYLYEAINTKSVITIQDNPHTIKSYKAILSLYLVYGFKDAKKLINEELINLELSPLRAIAPPAVKAAQFVNVQLITVALSPIHAIDPPR